VVAGGRHTTGLHEAWIAADPFKGGFRVLITGPHGFERTVTFEIDDDPVAIAERVRGQDTNRKTATAVAARSSTRKGSMVPSPPEVGR
jgi:hypothetical protein